MIFKNRRDAGRQLASKIKEKNYAKPYVIGLARGGVPVAYEVAKLLNSPLDALVVRKLGVPDFPELGFGAIAPNGILVLNTQLIESLKLNDQIINTVIELEESELKRRIQKYGIKEEIHIINGKDVILVDDGIATGISSQVSITYINHFKPNKIILATPVCSPDTLEMLKGKVDEMICLYSPRGFNAVAEWYEHFSQTTDKEVVELLDSAKNDYE